MVFVRRNTAPAVRHQKVRNLNLKRNCSFTGAKRGEQSNLRRHIAIDVSSKNPEGFGRGYSNAGFTTGDMDTPDESDGSGDLLGDQNTQRMLAFDAYTCATHSTNNNGSGNNNGVDEGGSGSFEDSSRCRKNWNWFGGLIDDVKKRYPLYKSDFTDGINVQCVAAIIFNAFAQIAGCVAFGGLMGAKTENYIGISETLLASAVGGLIYSFLAGQPILIVATTGPLLLFDASLFTFCKAHDINYLGIRIWIGLWLLGISLIFVAFEGSTVIRFFTRFTQEVFASLISLLFIAESVSSLIEIYKTHPLLSTYGICANDPRQVDLNHCLLDRGPVHRNQPNTSLLCTILMFGTFAIAWSLRAFQNSKFLTKNIRNGVGNFAGPVAIIAMVLLDFSLTETVTEKLKVPQGFDPTYPRPWFVQPTFENLWVPFFAALPALLLFVLVFMDVAISELVVSKPENKLLKGSGLHLDVLLVSGLNTGMCFFGFPWASVAIVRSLAHCTSLTVRSSGLKPTIVGVKEQRLTNVIISLSTGVSITMTPILVIVPVAVIFGIFFFMGLASIKGIQFVKRISLFFQLPQVHPLVAYVQKVRPGKMHLFTLTQLCWLGLLWGIKYTPAALFFPFILILLIPFRFFVLPLLFSKEELGALDTSGQLQNVQMNELERHNTKT